MMLLDDDADEPRARRGLFDSDDPPVYGILDPTPRGGLMSNLVAAPSDPYDPLWPIVHYGLPRPPFPATGPVPSLPYPTGTFPPAYPPGALGSPLPWLVSPWLSAAANAGFGQTGWQSPSWPGLSNASLPARPQVIRGLLQEDDDLPPESALLGEPAPAPRVVLGLFDDLEAFGKPLGNGPYSEPPNAVQAQAGSGTDWQMPVTPGQDTIVDDVEREFRELVKQGRSLGLTESAANLEHFLGGSGEPRIIHRDRARQFRPIKTAETANESRQQDAFVDSKAHAKKLLALNDGQTIVFRDNFARAYDNWDFVKHLLDPQTRDFALAYGNTQLKSEGDFAATRVGDEIRIEGSVGHYWSDDYDFHPERYGSFGGIKARDAAILQGHGRAKSFARKSSWPRAVKGKIRIENGVLKDPVFEWEDIDQ